MSSCTPGPAEVGRLLRALGTYGRDEIWLRATRVYQLSGQPDQASFEAVDADGVVLRGRAGLAQRHTLQCLSPMSRVVPGQLVHLRRDGDSVRVEILPVAAMTSIEMS